MQIRKLDLTGFGKFKNKTLELEDGINIIYGENESGKTTIHNFIDGIFYGFLKANVRSVRYEDEHALYEPWGNSRYSGIMTFLFEGVEYRIEREFTKGNENTRVYKESTAQDITDQFHASNKTRIVQVGQHFFGFNNSVFRNTISIKQLKSKTEKDLSKEIKEKLVNASQALDEKISVKDAIKSLERDLKDIGSERAPTSIYGTSKLHINKLRDDIRDIKIKKEEYDNLLRETEALEDELGKSLELLKDIEYLELQDTYDKGIELNEEIDQLEKNLKKIKGYLQEDDYKNNQRDEFKRKRNLSLIGMIANAIVLFITSNLMDAVNGFMAMASLIVTMALGFTFFKNTKQLKEAKEINDHNLQNERRLKTEYEIKTSQLESKNILYNRVMGNHSLEALRERLEKYSPKNEIDVESKQSLENEISHIKLELVRNERDLSHLEKELDSMVLLEEELKNKENSIQEMDKEIQAIELAKTTIEDLSKTIHEDFAPHINSRVSAIIDKITEGKYSNIKVDDKLDLGILNPENSEILRIDSLSGGTIDQLYFALRYGIIRSISHDNLPLILDDCFIQYDDNRLKNVLELLSDLSSERQIILFTCHKREKEILDQLGDTYNFIELR